MWMSFRSDIPFAITIYSGGINAISGKPISKTPKSPSLDISPTTRTGIKRKRRPSDSPSHSPSPSHTPDPDPNSDSDSEIPNINPYQDYIVTPPQPWLDGFSISPGLVRQFVAAPLGEGYTVEAQVTGGEAEGGLQFEVTPKVMRASGLVRGRFKLVVVNGMAGVRVRFF